MKQLERRVIKGSQVRAKDGEKPGLVGVASVYNQQYDSGWFVETVKPGAFNKVLSSSPDVRCLFNHQPDNLLGRTTNKTLRLEDSSSGLRYECDTDPNTTIGRDVQAMVGRGDLDGCSFSFSVSKQSWREEKDASGNMILYRDIEEFDELGDVGPVTFPAYTGTSVGERSLWPDGVPAEVRSHVPGLATPKRAKGKRDDGDPDDGATECTCPCDACQNGDCVDCDCDGCDSTMCLNDNCNCDAAGRSRRASAKLRLAEAEI